MFRPLILAWNSGAGKDSLAEGMARENSNFVVSKARVTTRKPRDNEASMTFVDRVTFAAREKSGKIIGAYEWVGDEWYGIDTDILRSEIQNHHPILPFWGDTLYIQEKYLMDLAWFCRENGHPIPLYFLLRRNNIERQEEDMIRRNLPDAETKSRIKRLNNPNNKVGKWAIVRLYRWLEEAPNIEGEKEFSIKHLLWLFTGLHKNLGNEKWFFRKKHDRP